MGGKLNRRGESDWTGVDGRLCSSGVGLGSVALVNLLKVHC